MAKMFVYFGQKEDFLNATQGNEYDYTSIVLIKSSKEIWNRGTFYGTPVDFDIADYLTKADATASYQPKGDYLTEHQSLDNYYTKDEVDSAVDAIDVTEQLVDYVKLEKLVEELAKKADKTEIEDMATKTWVGEQNYLTEVPEEYAKTTEVDSKIANVKSEIIGGAGEDYDTLKEIETWVSTHQGLYEGLVAGIAEKATKTELNDAIEGLADEYQPKGDYLTEHQSLDEYAKSADVTSELNEAIEGLSETYYTKSQVDEMFEWGEY